jgi:hypothetical protein
MIQFASGPVPKKKPKPKKIMSMENEEIFYDADLDIYDFENNDIEVFGFDENSQEYKALSTQSIILLNSQTMYVIDGKIDTIS